MENGETTERCGFVAVIGRPNSGKSSLINTVLGEQLCVVTSLPQTTRRNLRGIYTEGDLQLVFVDTPGMHKGDHSFNAFMIKEAGSLLEGKNVDLVVHIVDLSREFGDEEDMVAHRTEQVPVPSAIVFNKTDVCRDPAQKAAAFFERYPALAGRPSVSLSAIDPAAKGTFLAAAVPHMPHGPKLFPEEDLTDRPLRFFAAEYLQKAIILSTRQEVPHASMVEILDYRESPRRHHVEAVIHVETRGQRGIIVGKQGSVLDRIRRLAETEMSRVSGAPVSYRCHVKVTPKWRDKPRLFSQMGYLPGR